jgi:hypothetical protein
MRIKFVHPAMPDASESMYTVCDCNSSGGCKLDKQYCTYAFGIILTGVSLMNADKFKTAVACVCRYGTNDSKLSVNITVGIVDVNNSKTDGNVGPCWPWASPAQHKRNEHSTYVSEALLLRTINYRSAVEVKTELL